MSSKDLSTVKRLNTDLTAPSTHPYVIEKDRILAEKGIKDNWAKLNREKLEQFSHPAKSRTESAWRLLQHRSSRQILCGFALTLLFIPIDQAHRKITGRKLRYTEIYEKYKHQMHH